MFCVYKRDAWTALVKNDIIAKDIEYFYCDIKRTVGHLTIAKERKFAKAISVCNLEQAIENGCLRAELIGGGIDNNQRTIDWQLHLCLKIVAKNSTAK